MIDPKRDLGHVDGKKGLSFLSLFLLFFFTLRFVKMGLKTDFLIGDVDAVKKDPTPLPTEPAKAVENDQAATAVGGEGDGKGEVLNARGKIVISGGGLGGEDYGYCKPGDEDCG